MPGWIVLVVIADLIVTLAAVLWLRRRRAAHAAARPGAPAGRTAALPALGELRAFAEAAHARIGDHVRARWNGRDEDLPRVLRHLLDALEREARERGLPLDRAVLARTVEASLRKRGIAGGSALARALREAA
uniref:Uncharacterized protein n=1 Tax=Eiseniibacteriota bacterium TaxID=2212470 RepID=A0A832I7T8_UNCEI